MRHRHIAGVLAGAILLVAGIAMVFKAIGYNVPISMAGWWTLFLIIPSLTYMIKRGTGIFSLLIFAAGLYFLASAQGWLPNRMEKDLFGAVLLILVGLWFLFRKRRIFHKKSNYHWSSQKWGSSDERSPEYVSVFSGYDVKNSCKLLKAAKIVAVFSDMNIDMSEADTDGDIKMQVVAVGGNIRLKLPDSVQINVKGAPVLGSCTSNRSSPNIIGLKNVTIEYAAVLGEINIE